MKEPTADKNSGVQHKKNAVLLFSLQTIKKIPKVMILFTSPKNKVQLKTRSVASGCPERMKMIKP